MARILCFDSAGTLNSRGDEMTPRQGCSDGGLISANVNLPDRSLPVRIYGGEGGETRYIGWEFLVEGLALAENIQLRWWQEFFGDAAGLNVPPWNRDWPGVNPIFPWMREVRERSGATGVVAVETLTRHMLITPLFDYGTEESAASIYFPAIVHALWVRLGFYISAADSTAELGDYIRLRVYAHVGAHDELEYLRNTAGEAPYVYNAYDRD